MADGKINGVVKNYFRDGSLEPEKNYRMGIEHGSEQRYDSVTHEPMFETHYVDGKKEGKEFETVDNGNVPR